MQTWKSAGGSLLACTLFAASAPVWALAQVSATITDIHLSLLDLNPSDGITPFLTVLDSTSSVIVEVTLDGGHSWLSDGNTGAPDVPRAGSLFGPGFNASGLTLPGNAFGTDGPGATVSAQASVSDAQLRSIAHGLFFRYMLSPNTLLVATATVSATASATMPGELASGGGTLQLQFSDGGQQAYALGYATADGSGAHTEVTHPFIQVALSNLGPHEVEGYAFGYALATTQTPAVPEPETWGLMLLGLAALGSRRLATGDTAEARGR